jgi:hypothetical protein
MNAWRFFPWRNEAMPDFRFGSKASPSAIDGRASTSAIRRQRPNSRGNAKGRDGPTGDIARWSEMKEAAPDVA